MNEAEQELEALFRRAFPLEQTEEEVLWQSFEGTLPARQGWLSFHIAMEESAHSLRQAMAWLHYPVPRTQVGFEGRR